MNRLRPLGRKVVGLFIDDPILAAGVAIWIAFVVLLGIVAPATAQLRAYLLALGLAAILVLSMGRGANPSR